MTDAEELPHGAARYRRLGCRCRTCISANNERQNEIKRNRRGKPVPDTVKHGASCYKNWHCRCEVCTVANTAASRKYKNLSGDRRELTEIASPKILSPFGDAPRRVSLPVEPTPLLTIFHELERSAS